MLPDKIVSKAGCTATKQLAIYILLRRFSCPDTWYKVEQHLRRDKGWLICIYGAVLDLLIEHYKVTVTTIDVVRMRPALLAEWTTILTAEGIGERDTIALADGKFWGTGVPGTGQASQRLARSAGLPTNLIQRAYYNGHYKGHGAKAQHVLMADSMCYAHIESVRVHDATIMDASNVERVFGC